MSNEVSATNVSQSLKEVSFFVDIFVFILHIVECFFLRVGFVLLFDPCLFFERCMNYVIFLRSLLI